MTSARNDSSTVPGCNYIEEIPLLNGMFTRLHIMNVVIHQVGLIVQLKHFGEMVITLVWDRQMLGV
jgi:hypothetical protein